MTPLRPPSPKLPGAWASTWSLRKIFKSQEVALPKLTESFKLDPTARDTENYPPALSRPPSSASRGATRSSSYDDRASLPASHDDDESITSDDFHSFTSDEASISPSVQISITLIDVIFLRTSRCRRLYQMHVSASHSGGERQNKEEDATLLEKLPPITSPSDISSTLYESTSLQDVTLSDAVPSKVSGTLSAYPSVKLFDPAVHDDLANASSDSRLSESSSSTHPPSTVSRRSSASSSCSDGSVVFRRNEYDGESTYSNYSGLDYPRVCNLIARLDNGITSEQSLTSNRTQNASQVSPRQILRRHFENEHHDQRNVDFSLSQPDGNDPWTLSLEPILTSAEPSISQSSPSSSSGSPSASEDEDTPQRYFPTRFPSSHSQSFCQPRSPNSSRANATHDTESTTRRGSNNSIYALPPEEYSRSYVSQPPPPLAGEESSRSRNVVQKTIHFCSKFKKLLVPKKAPKQKDVKGLLYDYPLSDHIFRTDAPVQPTIPHLLHPSPREASPWSFMRHRGTQREPKMSLPTMPHPEHRSQRIVKTSTTSVDKHSYEYHARPKTLEEIKSRRRFSLPVFSAPPAGQPSSSIGHTHMASPLSRDQRRPFASSIHSASQNDSL